MKEDVPALKLSAQEKQLVEAFVASPNLSLKEAAEKCGLDQKSAKLVLARENVRRSVGLALLSERKERLAEIRDHVVNALWQVTHFDPKDLFDDQGRIKPVKDMPPNARAAIKGVKHGKYGLELVLVDRTTIQLELVKLLQRALSAAEGGEKQSTVLEIPAVEAET